MADYFKPVAEMTDDMAAVIRFEQRAAGARQSITAATSKPAFRIWNT